VPLARIERWFLRIGLFLLPLAFWWDTYDRYVLPKLVVARILVIGLLILLVARSMATRTLVLKRTPLDVPLAVFLFSALVSTLVAENQNVAVFGIYSRYDGLLTILTYAGLFWLSVQAIDGPADARALQRVLLAGGYVVAAIAILEAASDSATAGIFIQAYGTLGQQNVLGAFLVMLCPLAYRELVEARTWSGRILAINALAVLGAALVLTLSRSAWLGAAVAVIVLLVGSRRHISRSVLVGAAALLLIVGAVAAILGLAGGYQFERSVAARATSVFELTAWGPRPAIWRDSLHLIASRPLLGYGPDNFGLVYPRFQAASLGTVPVDKAHSETLQVAATQGLVGAAAYVLVLGAFIRAFWRGRLLPGAVPIFAGWVGYQVTLQLNFSALAASFPFWIFAAAAIESWGATRLTSSRSLGTSSWVLAAGGTIIAGLAVLGVLSTLPVYLADSHLLRAVNSDYGGRMAVARVEAVEAQRLAPAESVYAVEVGGP
jgi:O-antigen ligase